MSKDKVLNMKRLVLALCAVGVLGAGAAIAVQGNHETPVAAATPAPAVPANAAAGAPAPTPAPMIALPDFSVIASRNGPAVVNISTTGSVKTAYDNRG